MFSTLFIIALFVTLATQGVIAEFTIRTPTFTQVGTIRFRLAI